MFFKRAEYKHFYLEYGGIEFEIIRRSVKYFRVEFRGKIPRIIVPMGENVEKILMDNIVRIKKKYSDYLKLERKGDSLRFVSRDHDSFKKIISTCISIYSDELGVKVKEVKLRKMKRMWGNCRSNGVITLNSKLIKLPEKLISYVIYHEILHLNEKGGHSKRFKNKMRFKFPNLKSLDSELRAYYYKFETEKNG